MDAAHIDAGLKFIQQFRPDATVPESDQGKAQLAAIGKDVVDDRVVETDEGKQAFCAFFNLPATNIPASIDANTAPALLFGTGPAPTEQADGQAPSEEQSKGWFSKIIDFFKSPLGLGALGGVAGFLFGGPIGALLGALVGFGVGKLAPGMFGNKDAPVPASEAVPQPIAAEPPAQPEPEPAT